MEKSFYKKILNDWVSAAKSEDRSEVAKLIRKALRYNSQRLYIENFPKISCLPEYLPMNIKELQIINCNSLKSLPELPERLEKLALRNCLAIHTINSLPLSLIELDLSNCYNLKKIDTPYPNGLKYLNLHGCISLEKIESLPKGLIGLGLYKCMALTNLPLLPENLSYLDLKESSWVERLHEIYNQPCFREKSMVILRN